uniref:Uncharacterized protein n=1 Tax=Oryza barthii TaxID=65489 RepID=A0A0D3FQV2_9ORYZ
MASVGFGSRVAAAGVAPSASSSSAGRRRPSRVAMAVGATRGKPAPAEEEKSLADFIFGFIFKKDQLVETDPLLNKHTSFVISFQLNMDEWIKRVKPADRVLFCLTKHMCEED